MATLLSLVLLLTMMPIAPAFATVKAAETPTLTLEYWWERVFIMVGGVTSDGTALLSAPVRLEESQDKVTWTPVGPLKQTDDRSGGFWWSEAEFTPHVGRYYRVHFLGTDGFEDAYSKVVHLGYEYPLITYTRFSNPVAYDIKSKQLTGFTFASGEPGTRARLVVHGARSDGGDLVVFDNRLGYTHDPDAFMWDGRDEKGQRLRHSGNYTWTLTAWNDAGHTETKSGGIVVCRVLFTGTGHSVGRATKNITGYMIPGGAKVYLGKIAVVSGGDTITVKLTGPNGFSTASRSFPVTPTRTTSVTTYSGSSTPRYRGIYNFAVSAVRDSAFNMTVVQ